MQETLPGYDVQVSWQGGIRMTVAETALVDAFDKFGKATSLPGGPSLIMQRHTPTWEAWKALCIAFADWKK